MFGAWGLSQKKLVGRRFLTLMCTFTMFFSGGMIPTFLVIKELKLLNTLWAMVLPGAVSTYNMILMRTFFRQIPESLVEAAELWGPAERKAVRGEGPAGFPGRIRPSR